MSWRRCSGMCDSPWPARLRIRSSLTDSSSRSLITLVVVWRWARQTGGERASCVSTSPPCSPLPRHSAHSRSPVTVASNHSHMETDRLLICLARSALSPSLSPVIRSGRAGSVLIARRLETGFSGPGGTPALVLGPPQHAPARPPSEAHLDRRYEETRRWGLSPGVCLSVLHSVS